MSISHTVARGARRAPRAAVWVLCLAVCAASCGEEPAPTWVPLTGLLAREAPAGVTAFPDAWKPGRAVELQTSSSGAALRVELFESDWTYEAEYDVWSMPSGLKTSKNRSAGELRLSTESGPLPAGKLTAILHGKGLKGYALYQGRLVLGVEQGARPPERVELVYDLPGMSGGRGGRIFGTDFAADGITVLAGQSAAGTVSVPSSSTLRFGTVVDPILAGGAGEGGERESLFRVLLDGEVVFEDRQRIPHDLDHSVTTWHEVLLPAGAHDSATLVFEVEGDLQNTAILDPLLAPTDIGRRGARPWAGARPDIVVFLADTFRHDNLSAYGGRHGAAPNLDELAEESLVFARAWSSAPWTLPAHATMFSGFYPPQVRTTDRGGRLPSDVTTIAELLAGIGYRTGSVTDSGLVSSQFGLDQGFQYFSERKRDIDETLAEARAFLEADDGRPCFLFVQSYRVHWPYVVTERTRAEMGEELGIEGRATDLLEQALSEARAQGRTSARELQHLSGLECSPRFLETAGALRAHYLGGVRDLDREMGGFLDYLGTSGVLEHGFLVFTSDHGESFAEHGDLFHGRKPFEEQTRIPLMIAGRGVVGELSEEPASLIDMAPTLAGIAGLPAEPDWPGESLFSKRVSEPIFSFECSGAADEALALLADGKKVLLIPEGGSVAEWTVIGAFDLLEDEGELSDVAASADWPERLVRGHATQLESVLRSVVMGEGVELGAEKEAELQALGY